MEKGIRGSNIYSALQILTISYILTMEHSLYVKHYGKHIYKHYLLQLSLDPLK